MFIFVYQNGCCVDWSAHLELDDLIPIAEKSRSLLEIQNIDGQIVWIKK